MTKHSMEIFNTTSHSDHTYRETVFQAPVPVRATLIVGANKALGAQRISESGQCREEFSRACHGISTLHMFCLGPLIGIASLCCTPQT